MGLVIVVELRGHLRVLVDLALLVGLLRTLGHRLELRFGRRNHDVRRAGVRAGAQMSNSTRNAGSREWPRSLAVCLWN